MAELRGLVAPAHMSKNNSESPWVKSGSVGESNGGETGASTGASVVISTLGSSLGGALKILPGVMSVELTPMP